jgi:hypothetical protein
MTTAQNAIAEVNTGTLAKLNRPFTIGYDKSAQRKSNRIVNHPIDKYCASIFTPVEACEFCGNF